MKKEIKDRLTSFESVANDYTKKAMAELNTNSISERKLESVIYAAYVSGMKRVGEEIRKASDT